MYITEQEKGKYLSILSDGKFHERVDAGTDGAVERHYETKDGKKGSKWERVYTIVAGTIVDVDFHEGEFGKNIQLRVRGDEGECVISASVKSGFGEDIMKKLPNVPVGEKIKIEPYSFTNDTGRSVKGVTFWGASDKFTNYFYDGANGIPMPDKTKRYDSDDWMIYFTEVRKFLIDYTVRNVKPRYGGHAENNASQGGEGREEVYDEKEKEVFDITKYRPKGYAEKKQEIDPDQIPF